MGGHTRGNIASESVFFLKILVMDTQQTSRYEGDRDSQQICAVGGGVAALHAQYGFFLTSE